MVSAMVRRAVMVVAAPALAAGAIAAPAAATEYEHDRYKTVAVKVCKVVKDDYDRKHNDRKNDKKKFTIHIKSDHDYAKVKLRNGECDKVYVDYKYPKFKVTEDYVHGYELKYIKGEEGAYHHGYGKVTFHKGDKYVKIVVVNKEKDRDRHDKHDDKDDDKGKGYDHK